jgi:hypothetical protein
MGTPKRPRKSSTITVVPPRIASVHVKVQELFQGGLSPEADVRIEGVPPKNPDVTTTKSDGTFISRAFAPGSRLVTATKADFGPPSTGGMPVLEGPVSVRAEFVSNIELTPEPGSTEVFNRLDITIARRNPRLTVKVIDVTPLGSTNPSPLTGVEVEVIGVSKGPTNAFGDFVSAPMPYGKRGVTVRASGFFAEAMDGDFFQEIEVREQAFHGGFKRDMSLTVRLISGPSFCQLSTPLPLPFGLVGAPHRTPYQTTRAYWVAPTAHRARPGGTLVFEAPMEQQFREKCRRRSSD